MKELRKKAFAPVYVLSGEESYFIDQAADYLEAHVLTEAERAFNQTTLYGKEADYRQVLDAAQRYPMGADKQLVLLKEAQEMKTLSQLTPYLEQPSPSTVLVITYKHKALPGNTKFGKLARKHSVFLQAKRLYDNKIPGWITRYLAGHKLSIDNEAARLIAEHLGNQLSKVANELDKLSLNMPAGSTVDVAAVEQHIGISKDFNVFELQRALGQKNALQAFRIVDYFSANPKKGNIISVISALYSYFSKLYQLHHLSNLSDSEISSTLQVPPFFLKEYRLAARHYPLADTEHALAILREYDLMSKGIGYQTTGKVSGGLLREMIWRLLHPLVPAPPSYNHSML